MYKIVAAYSLERLQVEVNRFLKEGYVPIGTLVIENCYGGRYIQPMYKIEVTL